MRNICGKKLVVSVVPNALVYSASLVSEPKRKLCLCRLMWWYPFYPDIIDSTIDDPTHLGAGEAQTGTGKSPHKLIIIIQDTVHFRERLFNTILFFTSVDLCM